ncbi:MAG: cation transporter [Anaerolineae bacterium]|jgi:cobalt-zinc-cadmium efflux system protein|nr:cation transporter [Anaerolineae bacterium]
MQPHPDTGIEKRFLISIFVTLLILLAEVIGGYWTGSLALLSDAAHVFMDVFALILSFVALKLSARPADDTHSFGYHRLEVLAALINGLTLVYISFEIFHESWLRWQEPQAIKSVELMIIASIGLIANLFVAFVLGGHAHSHNHDDHAHGEKGHTHEQEDLNVKSAYLHVIGDALASVGVVVAGIIIYFTDWTWIDPLMSVAIGILILFSSWRLLKGSFHILIEGVPEGMSSSEIAEALEKHEGVKEIHDLHVWSICSGHIALSAHAVLEENAAYGKTMSALKECLLYDYGIEHTTIQFEEGSCGQGA